MELHINFKNLFSILKNDLHLIFIFHVMHEISRLKDCPFISDYILRVKHRCNYMYHLP
jgi:hypothetical protein